MGLSPLTCLQTKCKAAAGGQQTLWHPKTGHTSGSHYQSSGGGRITDKAPAPRLRNTAPTLTKPGARQQIRCHPGSQVQRNKSQESGIEGAKAGTETFLGAGERAEQRPRNAVQGNGSRTWCLQDSEGNHYDVTIHTSSTPNHADPKAWQGGSVPISSCKC